MSMHFLASIINAGMCQDLPAYLQRRVRPTNITALVMIFFVGIPFIIISYLLFPLEVVLPPAIGTLSFILVLYINYQGGIYFSRLLFSIVPISLAATYNAMLCGPHEEPITGVFLTELGFALIPFVIIDLKEKAFLWISTVIAAILIITFPLTRDWISVEADTTLLREGWLNTVTNLVGVIAAFGCMLGLAFINKKAEESSEQLINDMEEKNNVLQSSQLQLEDNLKKLEEAQTDEQKRNWASEGIARLSEILRSSHDSSIVYDNTIAMIVNYLKANQGGLFVVHREEDDDQKVTLRLSSCYAYSRKKYLEQEYLPGQGLLGQAYLEREYLYVTDIPQNYVRITSGLGESTPTSLLIMPLIVNESVEGMIELAAFKPFESHEIELVKKMGENVASYVQSNRINVQTKRLLEEAQQQAEELKSQEEEMKQNMEELAATQEEMQRKEKEYQQLIENLRQELATSAESN